jgi:hypothetical protein
MISPFLTQRSKSKFVFAGPLSNENLTANFKDASKVIYKRANV